MNQTATTTLAVVPQLSTVKLLPAPPTSLVPVIPYEYSEQLRDRYNKLVKKKWRVPRAYDFQFNRMCSESMVNTPGLPNAKSVHIPEWKTKTRKEGYLQLSGREVEGLATPECYPGCPCERHPS